MNSESVLRQQNSNQPRLSFGSAYGMLSLLLLAIIVVSMIPQFLTGLLAAPVEHSTQLIVHGIAFFAWYLLFSLQAGLASAGQVATHKKLGYASIPFALFLIASGGFMLADTMQSYQPDWTEQYLRSRTSFVWAIFHTLVSFSTFYILAVLFRRKTQVHKRLMVLASLSMMAASITRFAYVPMIPIDGTVFTLLSTFVLLAVPLIIDRIQRGKVHPALSYGTAVYVLTLLLAMGYMPTTSLGRDLAFFL